MKYFTIAPTERLAKYVRYYWVLEGEASPEHPYIYRSMADGCAELIFHYNGIFDELITGNKNEKICYCRTCHPFTNIQAL